MPLHFAKIENSPRLQRTLATLEGVNGGGSDGWYTTRDIIMLAHVCAVNSCISEVRANGYDIWCKPVPGERGQYRYKLMKMAGE